MNDQLNDLDSTTFGGRRFTRKMLARIQDTVATFPNLSLRELGHTVCEHLQWLTKSGNHKIQSCLKALEQMEEAGLIALPSKKKLHKKPRQKPLNRTDKTREHPLFERSLDELGPIELRMATEKDDIALWNEYVDRYHYLQYKRPIGSHLRYFIICSNQTEKILGCLSFAISPVWALDARDRWIGWTRKDREKRLNLILNNTRFLIFPWIKVKNLASKALSISVKQIADDWQSVHGYRPVLIETFVDSERYEGKSYRAANWQNIGKSSGYRWNQPGEKQQTSQKDIYVYPIHARFSEILRNEKSAEKVKSQKTKPIDGLSVNDPFVAMWQNIADLVSQTAKEFDRTWQRRKRLIDTMLLVFIIFRLVFSKNRQGYGITIAELWDQCHTMGYPLPQEKPIAPSALCSARKKLDETFFKILNSKAIARYEEEINVGYRWNHHRLFAVDGTKINLPRQLKSDGYELPSTNAHYPQGLVSCLYQLKSKIPYDFDLVSHNDERKAALSHLNTIRRDDIVVYDRGYFSYALLYHHHVKKVFAVFRLQTNTYQVVKDFIVSDDRERIVVIEPSKKRSNKICANHPEIKIIPITLRLIKYTKFGTTFILGTTLLDTNYYKASEFEDLYHARWGVEELYKISKILIDVEEFHSQSERGVKQELFAHFVLITFNRFFANQVEADINDADGNQSTTHVNKTEQQQVNVKNSLVTIARHLEGLFINHIHLVSRTVQKVFASIYSCTQKVRPNRKYERKSMKPIKKWQPEKKRKKIAIA